MAETLALTNGASWAPTSGAAAAGGGQAAGVADFLALLDAALLGDGKSAPPGSGRPPVDPALAGKTIPLDRPGDLLGDASLPDVALRYFEALEENAGHDPVAHWRGGAPPAQAALLAGLKAADAAEANTAPQAQWAAGRPGPAGAGADQPVDMDEAEQSVLAVALRAGLGGAEAAIDGTDQPVDMDEAEQSVLAVALRAGLGGAEAAIDGTDLKAGAQRPDRGAQLAQRLRQALSASGGQAEPADQRPAAAERGVEAPPRPAAMPDLLPAGRLPAPAAAPEQVATALATLQSLGEDAAGVPRFALPANAALPHIADPGGGQSNLVLRAAVPAVAAEILTQARNGSRQFEIRLDPPELGRIEVTLDIRRDGTMAAKLVVERPETLDMLMRDARGLEKTLQQGGLRLDEGAVHYQLRDQSAFERHGRPGHDDPALRGGKGEGADDPADGSAPGEAARRAVAHGAIDIRV